MFASPASSPSWIAPFDPEENDFNAMMVAPGCAHLLGTDQFGRDIFSRLVFGARTALIVGFGAAVGGGMIGLVLGVTSAYFGGWFDLVLQRIFDILMAFPLIILALAVVSVFGTGVFNVVSPSPSRWCRAAAASCARARWRCARCPMSTRPARWASAMPASCCATWCPTCVAPFLILLSAFVGQAILAEASLSYLGLGVQEPVPAWGLMLQGSAEDYATTAPWIAIFPGLAIVLTVLGASLFGDALRDAIDPKLGIA